MSIEKIVSLCKRRGFVFQSSEIYGGFGAIYDYGPLGITLKKNISQLWWRDMTQLHENIVGLDSGILMHPKTWEASGHVNAFNDPLVDCKECKSRYRSDELVEEDQEKIDWTTIQCPRCGTKGKLTEPRQFNLMFKTNIGPVEDDNNIAYLRPETAQGIYVNYLLTQNAMRLKVPFGIAQIGKAFRNEITPRNFIFRLREFEQMELEFFVQKGDDEKWHDYWVEKRLKWWVEQGIPEKRLKLFDVPKEGLSHYSKKTVDIMYAFPHGEEELEGIANRTDFDLGSHTKNQGDFGISAAVAENKDSTTKLAVQSKNDGGWQIPYVIEPSAGLDRGVLALLNEAYKKESLGDNKERVVLSLAPHLSPIKAAIIPLKKNNEALVGLAKEIKLSLQSLRLGRVVLENSGNIGKNYRRHDEVGTPVCVTVDFESLDKKTVTIRDRDTMEQKTIPIEGLKEVFTETIKK